MPTVAEILQLRGPLEESLRTWFLAQDPVIYAATRQNIEFQKKTPRVEIKAMIGQATGHRNICPDRILRYDAWRFQLGIQVVTMLKPSSVNESHESYVGTVREKCAVVAQESWSDLVNFPHSYMAEPLRDTGTQDTLKTTDGFEYSTLGYSGIIVIRQTAWPIP